MNETLKQKNTNLLEWYDALVFALVLIVLLFTFVARVVEVRGRSMDNTLKEGDRLLVWSAAYTPAQGDVIVVDSYIEYGKPLVKRVIAVGGDTIDINPETNEVLVNGTVLNEPYISSKTRPGDVQLPMTVPDGMLFLMGDNRENSNDSRFEGIGLIDERDVLGKVLIRMLPFDRIGMIE